MPLFEDTTWFFNSPSKIGITVLTTILIYTAVIILTRIAGLRTFAKMSSFDFAITIAIGSLIASTMLMENQSAVLGITGLLTLIGLQAIVARLRKKSSLFDQAVTNTPVLLMKEDKIIRKNMEANRITEADLYEKLREANITNKDQILAVVLETTGDVSVLKKNKEEDVLQEDILSFVAQTTPGND